LRSFVEQINAMMQLVWHQCQILSFVFRAQSLYEKLIWFIYRFPQFLFDVVARFLRNLSVEKIYSRAIKFIDSKMCMEHPLGKSNHICNFAWRVTISELNRNRDISEFCAKKIPLQVNTLPSVNYWTDNWIYITVISFCMFLVVRYQFKQ